MKRGKSKVVVWRPFPSPTKRSAIPHIFPVAPAQPHSQPPQLAHRHKDEDDAVVNRWVKLADILNGDGKAKTKKKTA